jgi:glutamate-1-semialdehyde 2,1-aminomutase
MEQLAPLGPVYQAGTLSGNPVAMAAGLKTLELIEAQAGFYEELTRKTQTLLNGLVDVAQRTGLAFTTTQVGGMFGLYFNSEKQISTYAQVMRSDAELFKRFFHGMLNEGIYLAPSAFEAGFVSSAHSDHDIHATIDAAARVFARLK